MTDEEIMEELQEPEIVVLKKGDDVEHAKCDREKESATNEDFFSRLTKWTCPICGDWFHMPFKYCKCKK